MSSIYVIPTIVVHSNAFIRFVLASFLFGYNVHVGSTLQSSAASKGKGKFPRRRGGSNSMYNNSSGGLNSKLPCAKCPASFLAIQRLESHARKCRKLEDQTRCKICGVPIRRESRQRAYTHTHIGENPYKCEVCDMCTVFIVNSLRGSLGETHLSSRIADLRQASR